MPASGDADACIAVQRDDVLLRLGVRVTTQVQHHTARVLVGTAGWSVTREQADVFPREGTHLQRYAARLSCAEINSSFYRPHRRTTYAKWAAQTPEHFRFSVKMPRTLSHEMRLRTRDARAPLASFLEECAGLGEKLGVLLLQLPPSLELELDVAERFFALLREHFDGFVVCEPRHASWFDEPARALLERFRIGRVVSDPLFGATIADDATSRIDGLGSTTQGRAPGRLAYLRLHGSPKIYWSRYTRAQIERWRDWLIATPRASLTWCIFDNTAAGAALTNALEIRSLIAV